MQRLHEHGRRRGQQTRTFASVKVVVHCCHLELAATPISSKAAIAASKIDDSLNNTIAMGKRNSTSAQSSMSEAFYIRNVRTYVH
jgi:hypothetical protein